MNALQLSLQRLHRKRKQQIRRSVSEDCRKNEVNEDSNSKVNDPPMYLLKYLSPRWPCHNWSIYQFDTWFCYVTLF